MANSIPLKWQSRPEQDLILERFKRLVELKKKFFIVESPVGTGKSYSAVIMANHYKSIYPEAKFDILTNTKQLQDQYTKDFEFIKEIKGKENYVCYKGGKQITCSEGLEICKAEGGTSCTNCSYKNAFNEYKNSDIGILNFSLFFSYFIYIEDVLTKRNAKILFIDEAHLFEEGYSKFVNSFISISYLVSLDIKITPELSFDFENIKTKQDFADFLKKHIIFDLINKMNKMLNFVKTTTNINNKILTLGKYRKISRTKCKMNRFLNDEENWNNNWVLETGYDDKHNKFFSVEVIFATKYLSEIWDKYDHVVLLSGTILDKTLFSSILNIPKDDVVFTTIDSPFKISNRPIYFLPKGKMSFDCLIDSYTQMLPTVSEIINKHKEHKGIIHTGNYKLSDWLKRDLNNEELKSRLIFHNSVDREEKLNEHLNRTEKTVIVSPSMTNGVDLKDDLSRFQILLKIPYPALETQRVKMRMKINNKWYIWKTMCEVIQECGRSVRNENDWAFTYILDSNFTYLMSRIQLPKYMQESLIEIQDLNEVEDIKPSLT